MRSRGNNLRHDAKEQGLYNDVQTKTSLSTIKSHKRPLLKSQISNPELRSNSPIISERRQNTSHHSSESGLTSSGSNAEHNRSSTHPSSFSFPPKHPSSRYQFQLAQPRLSPLEYARAYLIEQAMSQREHRDCELATPGKQWIWSSHWEKFLILPRIPANVRRSITLDHQTPPSSNRDEKDSIIDPKSFIAHKTSVSCPRLSLHLGSTVAAFPSLMNLASFAGAERPASDTIVTSARSKSLSENPVRQPSTSSLLLDVTNTEQAPGQEGTQLLAPDYTPPPVPSGSLTTNMSRGADRIRFEMDRENPQDDDAASTHSIRSEETVVSEAQRRSQGQIPESNTLAQEVSGSPSTNHLESQPEEVMRQVPNVPGEPRDLVPAPLNIGRNRPRSPTTAVNETHRQISKERRIRSQGRRRIPGREMARPDSPTLWADALSPDSSCSESTHRQGNTGSVAGQTSPGITLSMTSHESRSAKLIPDKRRDSTPSPASFADGMRRSIPRSPTAPALRSVSGAANELSVACSASNIDKDKLLTTPHRRLAEYNEAMGTPPSLIVSGGTRPLRLLLSQESKSEKPIDSSPSAFELKENQDSNRQTMLPMGNIATVRPADAKSNLEALAISITHASRTPKLVPRSKKTSYAPLIKDAEQDLVRHRTVSEAPVAAVPDALALGEEYTRRTACPRTPSKSQKGQDISRTPSRLGSFFRRKNVSDMCTQEAVPAIPEIQRIWRPFEESLPDDDVFGATWMCGDDENNWAYDEELISARRDAKMEKERMGKQRRRRLSIGRSPHSSRQYGSTSPASGTPRQVEATTEILVDYRDTFRSAPTPPPGIPLPSLPPATNRGSSSRSTTTRPPVAPSASYRDKRPPGLSIPPMPGTTTTISSGRNKLRKASKESLRSTSSTAGMSGLRLFSAFRIGERPSSYGKTKETPEETLDREPRSVFEYD